MSTIKKLAGQTAIYGGSTIIGRFLNYLLVPIYTAYYSTAEYGSISVIYSLAGFFIILLLFGMETTYFRFVNQTKDKESVFNQSLSIVLVINAVVLIAMLIFSQGIANWLNHPEYQTYVIWFAFILVSDAIASLIMARLRHEDRAVTFAKVQLSSIGATILFNLIFIFSFYREGESLSIGWVFLANLIGSVLKPVLLYKELLNFKFIWNLNRVKSMIIFAFPLVVAGFSGIINELIDRILLLRLLTPAEGITYAESQVGIYSANYKLAVLITLFIQAFRYAAEPFFFSQANNDQKDKIYAKVMTYFVIVVTIIFLVISLNLPIFKSFLRGSDYWEGLTVVPLLMLANVFLGIYYNQSIWYKLADKTKFGAYISVGGAIVTLILNYLLIPWIGYTGSAITTCIVYFGMMAASYHYGKIHYPIKYNLRKIGLYLIGSVTLFLCSLLYSSDFIEFTWPKFIFNTILILIFVGIVLFIERPLRTFKKG
ncbi:oligosaccharide flippase family protein [Crocinitomix algicola]|uniref:oligosaccharide flippase family protein n=1 Tax=Crocinitomix algicola TaxID=1740263 RepID=UPI00083260DE|nr:oligosaccharide flippase family protein [Crocinitomix algicola]